MSKKVAPLVKEWASIMLFANYKTLVYQTDKDGKKHKASGGQRVMYANHHPCWDAKNRYGLPDEMKFDFDEIKSIFLPVEAAKNNQSSKEKMVQDNKVKTSETAQDQKKETKEPDFTPVETADKVPPMAAPPQDNQWIGENDGVFKGVPMELRQLMIQDKIMPLEVKAAIAQKGYCPAETPFENYPEDFVRGVLIGAWPQVRSMIMKNREELPY